MGESIAAPVCRVRTLHYYRAIVHMVAGAPMLEFLTWVTRYPRTYADAMAAWQSSCPRYTVWEDALAAELVQIDGQCVTLRPRGHALLAERGLA